MLFLPCWMPKDVAGTLYLLEASWLCKSCGGWKMMLRQQLSFATVIQIVRPSYDWCPGLIYWFSRSWDLGDIPSFPGVIRHATGDRDLQEPVNLEVATIHIEWYTYKNIWIPPCDLFSRWRQIFVAIAICIVRIPIKIYSQVLHLSRKHIKFGAFLSGLVIFDMYHMAKLLRREHSGSELGYPKSRTWSQAGTLLVGV